MSEMKVARCLRIGHLFPLFRFAQDGLFETISM